VDEAPDPSSPADAIQIPKPGENSGVREEDPPEMRHIDSMPIDEDEEEPTSAPVAVEEQKATNELSTTEPQGRQSDLPPLPPVPEEPQFIDLNTYTDKDSRKIAEKEQKRVLKAYQQAVKDRDNAIRDRKKLIEKREKKARQEQEKALKAEQKQRLKEEREEEKRQATINPPPRDEQPKAEKAKRDKKFCVLPPEVNGKRDKCWVRVYMEGVDEVGAHCGLFFAGPQYESLVGDVGARIEEWVKEDATRRIILEGEEVD
jgi:hypothetical protein